MFDYTLFICIMYFNSDHLKNEVIMITKSLRNLIVSITCLLLFLAFQSISFASSSSVASSSPTLTGSVPKVGASLDSMIGINSHNGVDNRAVNAKDDDLPPYPPNLGMIRLSLGLDWTPGKPGKQYLLLGRNPSYPNVPCYLYIYTVGGPFQWTPVDSFNKSIGPGLREDNIWLDTNWGGRNYIAVTGQDVSSLRNVKYFSFDYVTWTQNVP